MDNIANENIFLSEHNIFYNNYCSGDIQIDDEGVKIWWEYIMFNCEKCIMNKHVTNLWINENTNVLEIWYWAWIFTKESLQKNPKRHTVFEIHPEIIKIANQEIPKSKDKLFIIEWPWQQNLEKIDWIYDTIMYDSWSPPWLWIQDLINFVKLVCVPKLRIWWNFSFLSIWNEVSKDKLVPISAMLWNFKIHRYELEYIPDNWLFPTNIISMPVFTKNK